MAEVSDQCNIRPLMTCSLRPYQGFSTRFSLRRDLSRPF
jgi:hypothetical protein